MKTRKEGQKERLVRWRKARNGSDEVEVVASAKRWPGLYSFKQFKDSCSHRYRNTLECSVCVEWLVENKIDGLVGFKQ